MPKIAKILYLFLLLGGCSQPFGSSLHDPPPSDDLQADLDAYDRLQAGLERQREQVLDDDALELFGSHANLYYKTYPTFSAKLHRLDDAAGTKLHYGFSIGAGDEGNYRASDELVVSAERAGDVVRYHVYDATQSNAPLRTVDFPSPSDVKWWAYAVDGSKVYVVANASDKLAIYRFDGKGSAAPQLLGSLEAATGTLIGEFYDFDVAGQRMVFIESGRVWQLDLGAMKATSLQNKIQVSSGAAFDERGVTFTTNDDTLYYVDTATHTMRNLSDEIAASSYALNATYANAHRFYQDYTRFGPWVLYCASVNGVYAYNLDTKVVAPVLLPPRAADVRVVYRYPTALTNGALYVVGLMSASGSVGAEGPVFKVDLSTILR